MLKNTAFPAIFFGMFMAISFGIISIGHILSNQPLLFLDYLNSYGLDYADFFGASENIVRGHSPYNYRYVTTPIPAIVNIAFLPLGFNNARILFYILIPLSLAAGYTLLTSAFGFAKTDKEQVLLAGSTGLLFGHPFYFLLQRENIDGWVFFFLCLGLYWISKPKKELLSGLCFSLAIFFKIYPVLILLPILLGRKWRLLFWTGLWLVLWGLITLHGYPDFQTNLSMRSQFFKADENGSLFATVVFISMLAKSLGIPIAGLSTASPLMMTSLLYGLWIAIVIFADYKSGKSNGLEISSYTMYLPFMVALPKVVFHYSFILCLVLIPTICHLWRTSKNRQERIIIYIISTGLVMTQWQVVATFRLTENILAHAIPGTGLFIIMTGIAIFKILSLYPSTRDSVKRATTQGDIIKYHSV